MQCGLFQHNQVGKYDNCKQNLPPQQFKSTAPAREIISVPTGLTAQISTYAQPCPTQSSIPRRIKENAKKKGWVGWVEINKSDITEQMMLPCPAQ